MTHARPGGAQTLQTKSPQSSVSKYSLARHPSRQTEGHQYLGRRFSTSLAFKGINMSTSGSECMMALASQIDGVGYSGLTSGICCGSTSAARRVQGFRSQLWGRVKDRDGWPLSPCSQGSMFLLHTTMVHSTVVPLVPPCQHIGRHLGRALG